MKLHRPVGGLPFLNTSTAKLHFLQIFKGQAGPATASAHMQNIFSFQNRSECKPAELMVDIIKL